MKINRGKIAQGEHDKLLRHSKTDFDQIVQEKTLVENGKVKMKLKVLTLPIPTYDNEEMILVQGGKNSGKGKDGDKKGQDLQRLCGGGDEHAELEHTELDFDEFVRYYQELLIDELELPRYTKMMQGERPDEEWQWNDFSRDGLPSDLDMDLTLEQAIERTAFDRRTEVSVDPRLDGWYGEEKPTQEPRQNAVEIYVMDISGSVSGSLLGLIRKCIFCLNYYLDKRYAQNKRHYIVFQDVAEEKTKEEFYSCESKGGTHISSGLDLALTIANKYEDYDKYLFFFSDFDNAGSDDDTAVKILSRVIDSLTYIGMSHAATSEDSITNFSRETKKLADEHPHMIYTLLTGEEKIKKIIYNLLAQDGWAERN